MSFFREKSKKLLLAEMILIISSVFIFRSLWLLMDAVPALSHPVLLAIFFAIGIGASIPALRYIIRKG